MSEIYEYLKDSIPRNHCRQSSAHSVLRERAAAGLQASRILDFGCGDGRTIDLFREVMPDAEWTGVDIASSPEVDLRRRSDGRFVTYDGHDLPFGNNEFDLVYSYQVLEHVRKPEQALSEVARVLRPGGLFIGQTSQFEPYHSYSLWNFTVYGFKRIAEDAGLKLVELRPGIDGSTLMRRSYEGRPPHLSRFFSEESPLNQEIELGAAGKSARVCNFRKLLMTGQFIFVLRLPKTGKSNRSHLAAEASNDASASKQKCGG